jgi:hypothetical protein
MQPSDDTILLLREEDLIPNDAPTRANVMPNLRKKFRAWKARNPKIAWTCFLLLVASPFILIFERPLWQPYVVVAWVYVQALAVLMALAVLSFYMTKSRWKPWRIGRRTYDTALATRLSGVALAIALVVGGGVFGPFTYRHLADYIYYTFVLEITDVAELPTTDHERIIPLAGVHTLFRERMNETEEPTAPDMVRIGSEYRWTSAVQPASKYQFQRFWNHVDEIISIPATSPAPNLDRRQPIKVDFEVGESKLFGANVDTCVRRAFGFARFFNYEPSNVFYLKNDRGEWVMVVALMRWSGILFPRPEFGGVQVIEQGKNDYVTRNTIGCGTWIPPEEVGKYPYLRGQNTMSLEVSRYIARSFRFQAGFFGPMPWNRKGDIRIADLPDDVNDQPFTLYFKPSGEEQGSLYHYFALEPFDSDKQGLAASLFIPADGTQKIYVYRHFEKGESPLGVTAVGAKVQESKKSYDWSKNRAVEFRPYLKRLPDANGKVETRFFWLATVVTLKDAAPGKGADPEGKQQGGQFIPGSVPEMAAVDAYNGGVVWLDPLRPEVWPTQLREQLGARWTEH